MLIKLFGRGGGCGGWNGSRNLPDGGGTNEGAGGGPDGSCREKEGGGCGGGDGGGEILLLLSFGSGLSFNLSNFHLKYPQPLVQIYLLNHPLVQALEDHHAVHRFYHQVLFVPYLFISPYSLVNVCVWEPYKLFSGVQFNDGPKRL